LTTYQLVGILSRKEHSRNPLLLATAKGPHGKDKKTENNIALHADFASRHWIFFDWTNARVLPEWYRSSVQGNRLSQGRVTNILSLEGWFESRRTRRRNTFAQDADSEAR